MKTRWLRTGPLAACAELCCKKPQASLPALMIAVRFGAGSRFALPGIARRRLLRARGTCYDLTATHAAALMTQTH